MGLFDSLKKVINNADNLKSQLDNVKNKIDSASRPNVQNTVRPFQKTAPASSVIKTPACVIQSGHKSAKPSVLSVIDKLIFFVVPAIKLADFFADLF